MFIRAQIGLAVSVALLCAAGTLAQQNGPGAPGGSGKIFLDVVVAPKSGPLVGDLQQPDFTLLDNNSPQAITSFAAITGREAGIECMVVIDAVNIDYQRMSYAREQVGKFLRAEGGHLAYPVAVAVFTDKGVQTIADFSTDGNALGAALDSSDIAKRDINRSGQHEASERFNLSLQALGQLIVNEGPRPGRKLIIWISPGWPLLTGARVQLDSYAVRQLFHNVVYFSTMLREAHITLDAVNPLGAGISNSWFYKQFIKGISKPSQLDAADLGLPVLAIQSGGLALDYSNDVAGLLRECLTDAAPLYEISFDPPPAQNADTYHHIEIKIAKPGLVARTREGYYAQPAPHN